MCMYTNTRVRVVVYRYYGVVWCAHLAAAGENMPQTVPQRPSWNISSRPASGPGPIRRISPGCSVWIPSLFWSQGTNKPKLFITPLYISHNMYYMLID